MSAPSLTVDHLNTTVYGGAATAARRLHQSLRTAGLASRFWYWIPSPQVPTDGSYHQVRWSAESRTLLGQAVCQLQNQLRHRLQKYQLKRALAGRPAGLDLFSLAQAPGKTCWDLSQRGSDIVHLHWVARMMDYPSFFAAIPDDFPIVWTLHDMYPLTGGCHYTEGCEQFWTRCRQCPQLGQPAEDDLSERSFRIKQDALRGKNLHVVAPSRWLVSQAEKSGLLQHARGFYHIPYGLDVQAFAPRERRAARRELGLADDRVVIGFGAESIHSRRKGCDLALEALAMLPDKRQVIGLVFGDGQIPQTATLPQIKAVGFVQEPQRLVTLYSAMDVFLMPSRQDNLPQTGLEAMACGSPVLAFRSGGIPDYVRPLQTGLLAEVDNAAELARHIQWMLAHPAQREQMGKNARAMIVRQFHQALQVERYTQLYRTLTANRNDRLKTGRAA